MTAKPMSSAQRILLFAVGCLSLASSAYGGFSLQVGAGPLTQADGSDVDDGSLVIVVVDLNNDGVSHPSQISFAPGADDFILGSIGAQFVDSMGSLASDQIVNNDVAAGTSLFTGSPTIDEGDSVALFWFPEITQASFLGDSGLAPGETPFGAYNTPESSTSDSEWVIPSDGGTVPLLALTPALAGTGPSVPTSQLQAQFNTKAVIPEPSSALLALLGSGALLFRRSRLS
jgi:hypothetical protein